MRLDGRFEPLTMLAQGLALAGVLTTAAVTWWRARHPRAYDAASAGALYQTLTHGRVITGPGPWSPR
jgi:hypothetical protein